MVRPGLVIHGVLKKITGYGGIVFDGELFDYADVLSDRQIWLGDQRRRQPFDKYLTANGFLIYFVLFSF
jgi:hypothetical protein